MNDFSLTTPALLFPTVSLLLLAYTNRFLTLATIIRSLHGRYHDRRETNLLAQIDNLRRRVYLIRNMQIVGVLSLLMCVASAFAIFVGWTAGGAWSFGIALLLMIVSLGMSLHELSISSGALDLLLADLEDEENRAL
jgi:hypothetical protein